jgi:cytochrome P450
MAGVTGSLPPGPSVSPLRQAVRWARQPLPFLDECHARYGDVFTIRLASMPEMVFVSHPAAVREVFRGDPEVFRAGEGNRILEAALGRRSLLLLDGAAHLAERKLMLPPFHGDRMRAYGELIEGVAARQLAGWPQGRPFDTAPTFRRITLEVIVRAVFGVEDPERMDRLMRALRHLLDATASPFRLFVLTIIEPDGLVQRLWRRHSPLITRVDGLIYEEIRRRRADSTGPERNDILSMLLPQMSDDQLRDELMTLLAAGHDTTATALSWAVERLARHPDELERLVDDDDRLDAVVKETMRLRPVVPIVLRQLAAPVEVAGWRLPRGVAVAPCIHLMHRRADVYPDPDRFRPERFIERPADTYSWIPFGGGTRRCLGGAFAMFEMKTVLRTLARQGRPLPALPGDERARRRAVTLAPEHGARILWRPRYDAGAAATAGSSAAAARR